MNSDFWSQKRVFLTGHTGFKGGWLSIWLQKLGAKVTGYALEPNTTPSLFETAQVEQGMNSIIGDIRDGQKLIDAIKNAKPDILFHMAAQPLVRYSYDNPVETYSTNVMGTVNLLEAVRQTSSIKAVVNVTTDKCYENKEWVWGYREDDPLGGHDPYSSSKACSELVTAAYRSSYFDPSQHAEHGVALASVRAGNVIGGGDWSEDRLIPDILRSIEAGKPACIRSPLAIRPWQHGLDPLSGYLLLAEKLYAEGPAFAQAWNFGPNPADAIPVQSVADRLIKLWGNGASWSADPGQHPHEALSLKLDCSKARQYLGWIPINSLASGLNSVVEWHRAYICQENMNKMCQIQIDNHRSLQ
jgi:CDP-glucose 4,6-dehydratase